MGNCVTNRTKVQTNFEKPQKLYIHQAFMRQTNTNPNSRSQQLLFEDNFIEMFDEIPFLGQCMYWFMLGFQNSDQKGIEFDTLLQVSEIFMLGKSDNLCIPNRVALVTVMIALYGQLDILHGLKQFGSLEITYLQTSKCMQVFVSMILRKMNPHEQPIKAFVDSIFAKINGNVQIIQLIKFLDTYMPALEEVIEDYFYNKFLGEQKLFRNPLLQHPSHIINQEWVALMYLYFLHKDSNKLELLYSTNVHDRNFELLSQLLTDCNTSVLFLIQCEEGQRQFNFGSYTNFEWKDDAQPNGSKEDCIFQMIPQFKVYKTKNDKLTRSQYTYLNSKNLELKLGIGFGGELAKDFRLFISSDLQTVTCKTHDKTYESGDLMQAQASQIQILEIWSVQQIQGTTQFKDLIQQKIDEQIELEEFEQPQVHLDEDISSYRSGDHESINQSLNQFVKKDSCDWDGESQHGFEEEIIIRNDGYEEIKKNEEVFEVVKINESNNKTSIKYDEIKPQIEQNQFEEVVIQQSDKMDSSALQMVYNVVSGAFGDAESDDWNGDNSDWKGNGSTSKNKVQLSRDLATITEELKESTNTQY